MVKVDCNQLYHAMRERIRQKLSKVQVFLLIGILSEVSSFLHKKVVRINYH